jgi:hypothetical protein
VQKVKKFIIKVKTLRPNVSPEQMENTFSNNNLLYEFYDEQNIAASNKRKERSNLFKQFLKTQ